MSLESPSLAQVASSSHAHAAPVTMQWIDLRKDTAAAKPYRRLWADKIDVAQRRWQATSQGRPLPVYTLAHVFDAAERPVLVSILFNMHDCELPGNGAGANLYARCPMRVVAGSPGAARIITIVRACHLYVPPIARPGDGPDPERNRTTVHLDQARTLHLRIVQYGRPVPSCDMDVDLE